MIQNYVIHTTLTKTRAMEQPVAEQVGRVYAWKKRELALKRQKGGLISWAQLAVLRAKYSSSVPSITTFLQGNEETF